MLRQFGARITNYFIVLAVCLSLMLMACGKEIEKSQTIIRNGVVYQRSETKPFTGYVTGLDRRGYGQGNFRFKKQYEDGILNGTSKYWYPNGKLESVVPYEDGRINGNIVRYYNNGKMKARIPIKNGVRGGNGSELFWDENGNIIKG